MALFWSYSNSPMSFLCWDPTAECSTTQPGVMGKLAEGALDLFVYATDDNIK